MGKKCHNGKDGIVKYVYLPPPASSSQISACFSGLSTSITLSDVPRPLLFTTTLINNLMNNEVNVIILNAGTYQITIITNDDGSLSPATNVNLFANANATQIPGSNINIQTGNSFPITWSFLYTFNANDVFTLYASVDEIDTSSAGVFTLLMNNI